MTNLKNIMIEIEEYAKENLVENILHGLSHIKRVLKYASMINKELKGDWEIIKCAILLHDIGYKVDREKHNEVSAKMAKDYLLSKNIDQESISNVTNSILTHSRQFSEEKPISLEAKVVYDADGLDLFGPIGLMRALLSCALNNKEFECIIRKLEWRLMEKKNFYSKYAKLLVADESQIIQYYLFKLKKQLEIFNNL